VATDVLIVGAGPTGLSAALFLAQRGLRVRVIDAADGPSTTSRAQVVNPRALELLAETGVSEAILAEGRPIHGVRFYEAWRPLSALELHDLPARFPMTVLPQARTELHLTRALAKYGIVPERGASLSGLEQDAREVRARVGSQTITAPLLLAADGAHSTVRTQLGIDFSGHAFAESWALYDVALATPLDLDHAHVSLFEDGLVFLLAIRPGLWRVFGNMADVLLRLPEGTIVGEESWRSTFHIADRCAAKLVEGRVALAGDAAHVHSPIGARGMNLGIEDAFVYAACASDRLDGRENALAEYERLRQPIHRRVVARMDRLTTLARGQPGWVGIARHYLIPTLTNFAPLAKTMREFLTGLDHAAI
jgi:2-polyprenyl-6-methoxyphenol hydroxylase-like FAD-dependent oxidoreductase